MLVGLQNIRESEAKDIFRINSIKMIK